MRGEDVQRRILNLAESYGKAHFEVADCKAHLSKEDENALEMYDDEAWLVCLDMPGVGDMQRVVVERGANGKLSIDHSYADDVGCFECQQGHARWFLPGEDEEE